MAIKSTGGSPWTNIPGATGQNYTAPGNIVGTTYYRVLVTDAANNCNDPVSSAVSITVTPQPTVSVSTLTPVICINGTFYITSTINNGSGIYAYQWQTSDNAAGPWSNITVNGDLADYSDILTAAGVKYFRVIVDESG
jgi:hypothetical protein